MTGIPPTVSRFMDSAQEKAREASGWTRENVAPLVDGKQNGGALDGITGTIRGWLGAEKGSGGLADKVLGFAEDHPNLGSGAAIGAGVGLFSLLSGKGIMGSAGNALKMGGLAALFGPALLALCKGLINAWKSPAIKGEESLPSHLNSGSSRLSSGNYVVMSPQQPIVIHTPSGPPSYGY